ncbi:hypothetical protein EDD86DRAFT_9139 [Gorgonomyces haynaldii]|nr:hypothetical protein EDD86DRAFT_9139 [Gorgonomyces haynaldii]
MTYSVADVPSMEGKTCLITGGTNGIGQATVEALLRKHCNVIFSARSESKGTQAVQQFKSKVPGALVSFVVMDNEDLKSVVSCAKSLIQQNVQLDVLITNSGIFCPDFRLIDGVESQMMINHLAHFLFVRLIAHLVKNDGRIIVVASEAGEFVKDHETDFDKMNDPKKYGKLDAYSVSKLGNILFAQVLAEKLRSRNVMVHSLHPGRVFTNIMTTTAVPSWIKSIASLILPLVFLTPDQGALTTLYCATDKSLESQPWPRFFYPIAQERSIKGKPADNKDLAEKCWKWSEAQIQRILGTVQYQV